MLRNSLYRCGESVQVPSHLHFGKEMLERMLEYGQHTAVIDADNNVTLTFGQLAQQTVDIALSLARIGVRKGDVVSVCSERKMEILPTVLAAICVGVAFAPTEISYGSVPLRHRIQMAQPKVMFMSSATFKQHKHAFDSVGCIEQYIIYDEENQNGESIKYVIEIQNGDVIKDGCLIQNDGDIKNDVDMNSQLKGRITNFTDFLTETGDVADFEPTPVEGCKDWAFILFSSGTTGLPKAVPVTHLGVLMDSITFTHESFNHSSILITPEWYLSFGIYITINCLWRGITCVFTDIEREHDYLTAIQTHKVKLLFLVPCLINELIKSAIVEQYDVTSVEGILTTSSPLARDQVDAVKKKLPNLHEVFQFYGMTESGFICSNLRAPHGPRDGSVGVPAYGFVIKVVDINTRKPLGSKQRGEICVMSPTVTPGYIGLDNSSYFDCEGFYLTGDVGYYDTDGYFYVLDRIKDLIKYNDFSIAPAEAEGLLSSLHEVKEAGVSSVEGAPAAAIVLQPGATISREQVADYLHNMMTFFRLEGGVHFVPHLPRGAGDKLDRGALLVMLQHIIHNNKESAKS